jgi:hypothetical protein
MPPFSIPIIIVEKNKGPGAKAPEADISDTVIKNSIKPKLQPD